MKKRKIIARAFGWQLLIGLVVGLIQIVPMFMETFTHVGRRWMMQLSSALLSALIFPILGIPFNTGGFTTRIAFESLIESLGIHRSDVVMSNLPLYFSLLLMQMVIVTAVIAIRYQHAKTTKDWVLRIIFALLFVNGLLNITWNWAGT